MTTTSMTLLEHLHKVGVDSPGDFLHGGIRLMDQLAIELEAERAICAGPCERSLGR